MSGPSRHLDLGKTWTDAITMLSANRDTILVLAGLFFFMPYMALAMFVPGAVNPEEVNAPEGTDPEIVMQETMNAIIAQYSDNWLPLLLFLLVYFVGSLAILALLRDRSRPTVGDAIVTGAATMPTYVVTQILVGIVAALLVGIPVGVLGQILPPAITVFVGFFAALAVAYFVIRLTLVMPVIAIEGELNPVRAVQRSWGLTAGNAMRLLSFLLLVFIATTVVSLLVTSVFQAIFAAFEEGIANIGNGFVTGIVNAAVGALFLAIYAAIHHQLAGPSGEKTAETFR